MSSKPKSHSNQRRTKPKPTVIQQNNKKCIVLDEEKALREKFPDPTERQKYVDELNEACSQPGFMEALYAYFMTRDISGFDPNVIPFEHELINIT
jgi:hypothetical protein